MSTHAQLARGPARALLVIDQLVLADLVKLALHHGQYGITVVRTAQEAAIALADWQPHLVVLDMEAAGSSILERLADVQRGRGLLSSP